MFDDFEKSVKAIMYDRLASPLVGSFITAWCVVNYKFFLIIFSGLTYAEKNLLLSSYFSSKRFILFGWPSQESTQLCELLNTIVLPALCSALYIFVYPWISKKVFKIWQQYIKEKREIKQKIEKEELLTLEESEKIREEFLRKRVELNALLNDKDNEIKELKDQYAILEEKYNAIREKTSAEKLQEREAELADKNNTINNMNRFTLHQTTLSKKASDLLHEIVKGNDSNIMVLTILNKLNNEQTVLQVGNTTILLDRMYLTYLAELEQHGFIKQRKENRYTLLQPGIDYIKSQQNQG